MSEDNATQVPVNNQDDTAASAVPESENSKNYLEFKEQKDLSDFLDENNKKFQIQIDSLKKENLILKKKDIEIKSLSDKLEVFKTTILEKYGVKNTKINDNELNYDSFDELEKSVIRYLNDNKIKYEISEETETKKTNKNLYI